MTKRESDELAATKTELLEAKALHFSDEVEPDIKIPNGSEIINGWLPHVNGLNWRAEKSCTSSVFHSFGNWDRTTSQGPRRLYSSELLATQAARSELAIKCAKALAEIDARIARLVGVQH